MGSYGRRVHRRIHGAETRSSLVKYDVYLLIRGKLYPHYFSRARFCRLHRHFSARRSVTRFAARAIRWRSRPINGAHTCTTTTRSNDDTDNSSLHTSRMRDRNRRLAFVARFAVPDLLTMYDVASKKIHSSPDEVALSRPSRDSMIISKSIARRIQID